MLLLDGDTGARDQRPEAGRPSRGGRRPGQWASPPTGLDGGSVVVGCIAPRPDGTMQREHGGGDR